MKDTEFKHYRIDLDKIDMIELKMLIKYAEEHIKEKETNSISESLLQKLNNPKKIKYDDRVSSRHASAIAKEKKSKEKIQNAINLLRMEDKKITAYSVSKTAGVAHQTATKYLNSIIEDS